MKKVLATIAIVGVVLMNSIAAYQTAPGAIQMTFKNGYNLVIDTETGVDLWK